MSRTKKKLPASKPSEEPQPTDADIAEVRGSLVADAITRFRASHPELDKITLRVLLSGEEGQLMSTGSILPSELVTALIENSHTLDSDQIEELQAGLAKEKIERAKIEVFGDEKPGVKIFRRYLRHYAGKPITDEEREHLVKTIQTVSAHFNLRVCHRDESGELVPVTISTQNRTHSKGRRLAVRESGGQRRKVASTQSLPELTAVRG